jgi:Asp-tRNA(Asn)/Glu-tRNA(Gln) amidotransferase A subunit family amidase
VTERLASQQRQADEVSPFSVRFVEELGLAWSFSCKEMLDVAGHPADCGHPHFGVMRGERGTSEAVRLFERSGATLVGKTKQSELAISGTGTNSHIPLPPNARHPGRVAGGSSVGCAVAVARGDVDFSLATDCAGSARIPAACHGLIGIAVAGREDLLADAVSLSPSLDQIGLIARDLSAASRALEVLLGRQEPRRPAAVLIPRRLVDAHCAPGTAREFARACSVIAQLGIEVIYSDTDIFSVLDRLQAEHGALALAEIAASLDRFLDLHEGQVDEEIVARLAPYRGWPGDRRAKLARLVRTPLERFRERVDAPILFPTLPGDIPPLGSREALGNLTRFSNLLGESSISVPVPGSEISLTLICDDEESLLGFAEGVSALPPGATGKHERGSETR